MAVTARRRGVRFAAALGLRATGVGRTIALSVLVVIGGLVGTGVYSVIAGALGVAVQGNTAELVAGFGSGPAEIAIAFVLVGIVAPFVEEITFRGIVFPSLKAAWGTAPALLVSGGIFGVVHLQPTIAVPARADRHGAGRGVHAHEVAVVGDRRPLRVQHGVARARVRSGVPGALTRARPGPDATLAP